MIILITIIILMNNIININYGNTNGDVRNIYYN